MSDIARWLVIGLVGNLLLAAFIATLQALFPQRLARARALAEQMPGRAFVVGLVNVVFFGSLALACLALADALRNGLPRVPALLLVALVSIGLCLGLTAVARLVGERLWPEAQGLRPLMGGTLALSLGSALPIVGWFGLLPYAGCLGLGALILSFFFRRRPDAAEPAS